MEAHEDCAKGCDERDGNTNNGYRVCHDLLLFIIYNNKFSQKIIFYLMV
jgi:hypothetical protein